MTLAATQPDSITDIKLNLVDDYYDLDITEEGDFVTLNSFDTAILMSLLTDVRADESEIQIANQRRGWLGNLFNTVINYEIGSKLWLLDQSRNNQLNLNRGIGFAQDSLLWLVTDNHCTDIKVTGQLTLNGIQLNIIISRVNDVTETSYILWENSIYI